MVNKLNTIALLLVVLTFFACRQEAVSDQVVKEKHRSQYHFTPDSMWMNDPNGMFYYEGTYHLFYQYFPGSIVWGPMHWGHAVSKDLVTWEHKDIALYPDSLGYIFSGSAVVDVNNTSGLAKNGETPIVAIFTHHNMAKEKEGAIDFQYQSIAYSLDGGETFTKYAGNPVIKNPGIRDFRDPKVFWHEPSKKWVMIFAAQNKVMLYNSPNLTDWALISEFGASIGAHGGVWECPDLFELKVEGTDTKKWVMLVSINPGAPNGGSGTQYFVGDFNGTSFVMDKDFTNQINQDSSIWIDYGRDNYAGVTWSNVPESDGRRLFMGWMSNWDYAQQVPTKRWRSAMTLARSLHLEKSGGNYLLVSKPVDELSKYQTKKGNMSNVKLDKPVTVFENMQNAYVELSGSTKAEVEFKFTNEVNDEVVLTLNKENMTLTRKEGLGIEKFSNKFAGTQVAPRKTKGESFDLKIYIDQSSIEIFADGGKTVMTSIYFFDKSISKLTVSGSGGQIDKISTNQLKL